jgi:hypothetical protein
MRNVSPEAAVSDALDATLADLREALAGLHRPASLIAAESALIDARTARANAADVYRDAIRIAGQREAAPLKQLEAAVVDAQAALARADRAVERAQDEVNRRRAEHGRTIAETVAEYRGAAAAAVNKATQILSETAEFAAREHLALPDVLAFMPASAGLISELYRSIAAEKNRGERAFNAAARAIGKPNFKPPEVPKTWKGRLADVMGGRGGGEQVEGDVPVVPGSSSTKRKIPKSALDRARLSTGR